MITVEDVLAALRHAGGRITSTRRATVEALLASPDRHTSAEEIVDAVRRRHADVAESTIYRTLATLEDLGVVTHMHLDHGPATFHLSDHEHRHLVCRECRAIIEVPATVFAAVSDEIERAYGFVIEDEHFAVRGVCRECRGRAQAAGGR